MSNCIPPPAPSASLEFIAKYRLERLLRKSAVAILAIVEHPLIKGGPKPWIFNVGHQLTPSAPVTFLEDRIEVTLSSKGQPFIIEIPYQSIYRMDALAPPPGPTTRMVVAA